ncbi:uncharacterized protein LOC116163901 [Photinus pyralis]|uniref:uncharacterized protein LOC116163901 n=1 Tax=Photinus pyralis TaxID=7054 RepID=UPI001267286F|nr:uncharacterized protein LOC116163901 [Photinus pyralis]
MSHPQLTKEQEAFLEECLLEFSDRYTDADFEYKKTYDRGVPPPPIMFPWYGRPKLTGYRRRNQGDHGGYRDRHDNNFRGNDQYRDRREHQESRFRPY